MLIKECRGCGYCCLQSPCFNSVIAGWRDSEGRCTKLQWDKLSQIYRCEEIKTNQRFEEYMVSGKGCSSLNSWRKEVIYRG